MVSPCSGFSQHCGGEWYRWRDVRVTGGTHTVVAAADGSQANYRFPNASQAPDWTGCANLPARTTTLVSYASNIRDRTGADWSWSPPEDGFRFGRADGHCRRGSPQQVAQFLARDFHRLTLPKLVVEHPDLVPVLVEVSHGFTSSPSREAGTSRTATAAAPRSAGGRRSKG